MWRKLQIPDRKYGLNSRLQQKQYTSSSTKTVQGKKSIVCNKSSIHVHQLKQCKVKQQKQYTSSSTEIVQGK